MEKSPAGRSDFGTLLRQAREKAGLSRQELGARVGLDASHIFRIETGDRRPSRESALALADALGLGDQTINQWLLAAGFAPMPLLAALRTAVRTRGTVRTRSAGTAAASHWDPAVWARRLESIGLREAAIERLMAALGTANLAEQEAAARALAQAFSRTAETLESPIRTAVVPAAGGQHRLLASHVVQRLLLGSIAEAASSGISGVVLVLPPGSTESLYSPLREAFEVAVVPRVKVVCREQARPEGLGAAVALAEDCVGGDPFVVLLPDDVVRERAGRVPDRELHRMIAAWKQLSDGHLVAVTPVPRMKMPGCGVARRGRRSLLSRVYPLLKLVEKPDYSDPICSARNAEGIVGRYVLQPAVFDALREVRQQAAGRRPIELTDALELLRTRGAAVYGYEISAHRRDIGEAVGQAGELIGG